MFPIKPMPEINNFDPHATDSRKQSASQKFISFAFGKLVRLWPADSRDWALAMQAELPQMESTQQSLQWLAGGIMSLGKAWWNGATASHNKKELAPVKKPGILAALVTVAALAILLIPSANQGLRAALTSWHADSGPNPSPAQHALLLKIASEAESRGDAKTIAFVAMRIGSAHESVSLSNKAVAMDPSLTWIFSQAQFGTFWEPQSHDWAAKLEAWDKGNATAFLVKAQIRAAELNRDLDPNSQTVREGTEHDQQWLDDGRRALESPRFDSYSNRRFALNRDVFKALGIKDPEMIGSDGLKFNWVNTWPVQTYSTQLLKQAKAAAARGDNKSALRDAWVVAHFGEGMRAHGDSEVDRRSGIGFMRSAYAVLQPMLAAEGRTDEAAMISAELETTRPGAPGSGAFSFWTDGFTSRIEAASVQIHVGAACSFLFASALLLAGLWLLASVYFEDMRSGGFYRAACRVARYSPAGLSASLALLAVSYSPIANAVTDYLDRPISTVTRQSLLETYFSMNWLPNQFRYANHAPYYPAFWMLVMAVGGLTVLLIIGRNILNRAPRHKVVTA
jgi:hypothetical protein